MNILDTVFLGFIQGLTEFLPVSSSGHLVLFQNLLGFKEPELLLDCSLHIGTLLAVCLYFHSDLKNMAKELFQVLLPPKNRPSIQPGPYAGLALWVVVASVPTGLIGWVFKSSIEGIFGSVTLVGAMLLATGVIVALTKWVSTDYGTRTQLGLLAALCIGTAQGLAIMPGISRSGATIACGLLLGLDRELAGRFSFILAIPAIIGALLLQLNTESLDKIGLVPLLTGTAISAIVGFLALRFLMNIVKKGRLYYFAPYCWAIGLAAILA